ncbi:MAG: hypothetical protein ACKVQW_17110 [Pyrinomonadaceae bacterium]
MSGAYSILITHFARQMVSAKTNEQSNRRNSLRLVIAGAVFFVCVATFVWFCSSPKRSDEPFAFVSTVAGRGGEFGEAFAIAERAGEIYVSDGLQGKIWRVSGGEATVFADDLHTPSAIAFDDDGNLIVADPGTHTIKSVNASGEVTTIAGVEGSSGSADGDALKATFNAPVGIAIDKTKIYVADTYNDRIRVIENGSVTTLADKGFDTPSGIAIWRDKLLVADTGNRKIRVIEPDGSTWTLAGTGDGELKDGLLLSASFVQPTAIAVGRNGSIFVADGNAVRQLAVGVISTVRTITQEYRGLADGAMYEALFNRPSGLAFDGEGKLLVADSENRVVRRLSYGNGDKKISAAEVAALRGTADEFRNAAPARWPFDPPDAKRDVAGTLGEIRGEMTDGNDQVWFHNGLDIAGAYGETARFIRDEKVLRHIAVENFGNLRELIRMPTLGYIHVRIGRDANDKPFADPRFLFGKNSSGIRVPRGTSFKAGDAIGTLNAMNHVHLIAGRSGSEMNALDALALPNLTDTRPPTIEKVALFDENKREIETRTTASRIRLAGKVRIVARAFDQIDGNPERRRLGVYKLGYQLLNGDGTPISDIDWTIVFDRLPPHEAVKFVYASGSKSGATGETIFDYLVTNFVHGDGFREGFLDTTTVENGIYKLRVFAADYFGNEAYKDLDIEVLK